MTVTQTHSAKETTKHKQPQSFTVVQKREFCNSVGKQREREREEVKFTKGGGRNVFKTGVQLTAAADLESVWEPRGGVEEHRNLRFEVLSGGLKLGRSVEEGTFQRV